MLHNKPLFFRFQSVMKPSCLLVPYFFNDFFPELLLKDSPFSGVKPVVDMTLFNGSHSHEFFQARNRNQFVMSMCQFKGGNNPISDFKPNVHLSARDLLMFDNRVNLSIIIS